MSYPERTSSSKRQRRIASASVSSINSNWAAVTAASLSDLRLQEHSSASSACDSARLRSRVAGPKVWDGAPNVTRPRDALPRTSGDRPVGLPRDPARAPHPARRTACILDCVEQLVGVDALVAAAEERCRGTPPHELDVDVQAVRVEVAEETSVAVGVIESRVPIELDSPARRGESFELMSRLTRVALPLTELGCVDLHEADTLAVAKVERVPVADPCDGRHRALTVLRLLRAAGERRKERDDNDCVRAQEL